jgi:hypothetical protein
VIVDVRFLVVIGALVALIAILVRVHERRVVVLVLVVLASMIELTEHRSGVVVRNVVVVVGMHESRMGVLMLLVIHHPLHDGALLHGLASLLFGQGSHAWNDQAVAGAAVGLRVPFGSLAPSAR